MTLVSERLRYARELFIQGEVVDSGLARSLSEMERDLRVANATLARELGLKLCPHCWPPELITTDSNGHLICQVCGEISYEKAA